MLLENREGKEQPLPGGLRARQGLRLSERPHESGVFEGTLDYVLPEQIRGERLDPRSDVYALGCLLHQALTAQVPYPHEDEVAKLWAHMHEPPPAPSALVPGLPRELDSVVRHAMAKEPKRRFETMAEFRDALATATSEAPRLSPRRRRGAATIVGVAALAFVVAAVASLEYLWTDEPLQVTPNSLVALDTSGGISDVFPAGTTPSSVVAGAEALWFLSADDRTVTRLDPTTGATRTIAVALFPTAVAAR